MFNLHTCYMSNMFFVSIAMIAYPFREDDVQVGLPLRFADAKA